MRLFLAALATLALATVAHAVPNAKPSNTSLVTKARFCHTQCSGPYNNRTCFTTCT
jgi:hypothetical protein